MSMSFWLGMCIYIKMTVVTHHFYFASQTNLCKAASLLLHPVMFRATVFFFGLGGMSPRCRTLHFKRKSDILKLFYLIRHNVKKGKITRAVL